MLPVRHGSAVGQFDHFFGNQRRFTHRYESCFIVGMQGQVDIGGFCSDQFPQFYEAFEKNFLEGHELGASLCLTLEGETIVDLRGGFADKDHLVPWQQDTIACVFSSSKIPTIICALILIDRGLMSLDEPVATYWPEFAQHGKGEITVMQALTHRARVPGINEPQPMEILSDWHRVAELIAAEKPWFAVDTLCYHPVTYGFLIGELVQRVSGKGFREFLNEELINPLGADFQMGLTDKKDLERVAELLHEQGLPAVPGTLQHQVFGSFIEPEDTDVFASWFMQSTLSPAVTGHTNASGLCKLATMMANDGLFEKHRYLSSEMITELGREHFHGVDPMLGDLRLSVGFGLDGSEFPAPTPESFHWGGYGGSWCFTDSTRKLAGAYVMNHCLVPDEWREFVDPRMNRFFDTIRSTFIAP